MVDIGGGIDLLGRAETTDLAPVGYQWQKDGVDIPRASEATLQLSNVTLDDAGAYWLTAFTSSQWARGSIAHVTVVDPNIPRLELRLSTDGAHLDIQGPDQTVVDVEVSSDLAQWDLERAAVALPASLILTQDPGTVRLFYRARVH